jgi:hypothetical protein
MQTISKNSPRALQLCLIKAALIFAFILSLGFYTKGTPGYFIFLFLGGWLIWTFLEYLIHRFLMHELLIPGQKDTLFHHHEHHSNPSNLKVNFFHRTFTLLLGIMINWVAWERNSTFTIFAGFFTGFLMYNILHYLLHKPVGKYIFPRIQRAHILHHTRYPNQGYSFSTILWDWLFNTLAPAHVHVTEKMRENYFNTFNKGQKTKSQIT